MRHTGSMETNPVPTMLPHLWKSTLISGILTLAVGVVVLMWTGHSIVFAAVAFGVYLLITGFWQVAFAFGLHVSAGGRVLLFISGAASLVLAFMAFRHFSKGDEATAVYLLAIWIGIGFIFRGVATTVSAISDPTLPGRGWEIFLGVMSLLAGMIMLGSPFNSIVILAQVVGIWLLVIGTFEIVSAFRIRTASKNIGHAIERIENP
jgi:uncharacterized membrane protein HdeD (DUF308 family)